MIYLWLQPAPVCTSTPLKSEESLCGPWMAKALPVEFGSFFFRKFFFFFLGFEVKREERERKEFVSSVADIIPKILPAAPPWTVWQTCPWPPTLSVEDNGPSESVSRCVWAKPKRARARAGNGQEGFGMRDREAQCDWSGGGVGGRRKKKKEICDVRARSFSGFVLIAQGHFSLFAPRPGRPIRASLQNV